MVKTSLVEADLIAGWRLLIRLFVPPYRALFRVKAAFWLYYPESEEWRFVIATPLVDEKGPLDTYSRLQDVLQEILLEIQPADLYLQNIAVISPSDHPLVKASKSLRHTLGDFKYVQFTKTTMRGSYIEDAYLYNVPPSLDWSSKHVRTLDKPARQARPQQHR